MAEMSFRERANLVISGLAAVVLVAGILTGSWLTVGAMLLMIIAQLGTFYGSRHANRS